MIQLLLEICSVTFIKVIAPAWSALKLFDLFFGFHIAGAYPRILYNISLALLGIFLCSRIRAYIRITLDRRRAAALGAELPPVLEGWAPGSLDLFLKLVFQVKTCT